MGLLPFRINGRISDLPAYPSRRASNLSLPYRPATRILDPLAWCPMMGTGSRVPHFHKCSKSGRYVLVSGRKAE